MGKIDFNLLPDLVEFSGNWNTFDYRLISGIANEKAVLKIASGRFGSFRVKGVPLKNHVA